MAQRVDAKQALRMLPRDYTTGEADQVYDTRTPEEIAEDAAIRAQSLSEGIQTEKDAAGNLIRKVTFKEKDFPIASSVGLMPLMEFAFHANSGMDTADMGALAAIYEMLKDCIDPESWDDFRQHAKVTKAGAEDMMAVVEQTIELLTAKPTGQDSGSSSVSHSIPEPLTDTSSGQAAGLVPVSDMGRVAYMG